MRRDLTWWIGTTGKSLIGLGVLIFGFIAYQLWGTGIETSRAQRNLRGDYEQLAAERDGLPTTVEGSDADGETPLLDYSWVMPEEVVGRIEMPSIDVDKWFVEGVGRADLRKGPGHYPTTALPGELGNAAIAGHRTTFGAPFDHLPELEPGDDVIVTTPAGRFVYVVTGSEIVGSKAGYVVETTDQTTARLTLTTCHPRATARQRWITYAELDTSRSDPAGRFVSRADPGGGLPGDEPTIGGHWFADRFAIVHVAAWGTLGLAILAGGCLLARRQRNAWIGLAAGVVPLLVVLYFFYQNVNRLLPSAL